MAESTNPNTGASPETAARYAARGAVAGAASEAGSHYRAAVAAYIAAHVIAGQPVAAFDLGQGANAAPETVELETDDAVDDIASNLAGGVRVLLQGKRALDFTRSKETGIGSVAAQWRAAVADGPLEAGRTRIIAVTQTANGTVRALRDALARRRGEIAGAMSRPEAKAIEKLQEHLRGVDQAEADSILDAVRIWELKVEDEADSGPDVGRLLLRGFLADETEAPAAWRELVEECKHLARARQGRTRDGFVDRLRELGYALKPDTAGSPGARMTAIGRYRQLVVRRGRTLDFLGLAASIPPLPVDDVDARVWASTSADRDASGRSSVDLAWGLRRRGRVLLTGLPGGGKSTAVRIAAATWAARVDWPLPVVIQLHRLARRLEDRSLRDALLELAVEDSPLADREALTEEIEKGLDDASVALFLDGLDEARERRHDLARELRDFIAEVHPDTEILVTTRDVAYADGAILGFPELRLAPPQNPKRTVQAVLRALATAAGHDRAWIRDRVTWITERLERDPALKETPLLPVILAVLSARHELSSLPSSRAELLRLAVHEAVAQWETHRPGATATLGPLSGQRAAAALTGAFVAEAALLAATTSASLTDVIAAVTNYLAENWDLPPADAGATAEEAVSFWDESGFFVIQGADPRVAPRIRLFAEVGEAWRVADVPEEAQRAWVREVLPDDNRREALRLAAGLSPAVAEEIAEVAAADGSLDMLRFAAETLAEIRRAPANAASALADALGEGLVSEDERWERAVLIAELPATSADTHARVDQLLDESLPPRQHAVAAALAVLSRNAEGPEADVILEAVLKTDPPERPGEPVRADDGVLHFVTVDQAYMRAKVGAARMLFPRRPEVADLVAAAIEHSSFAAVRDLEEVLTAGGRRDLVVERQKREARRFGSIASQWKDHMEAERRMWALFAELAEPGSLEPGERRRLDSLVDLWHTLELPSAPAFEPEKVLEAFPDEIRVVTDTAARVAGFDLPTIAAEARLCLDVSSDQEYGSKLSHMLYDGGSARQLNHWERVDDKRAVCAQLVPVLGIGRWASRLAARLLIAAQDPRVGEEIEAAISSFRPHNRVLAGATAIALGDGVARRARYRADSDPMLRAAAAHVAAGMLVHSREALDEVAAALADGDDTVRAAALRRLDADNLPDGSLELLERAKESAPAWTCNECGTVNDSARSACSRCSASGPDVQRLATELRDAAFARGTAASSPREPGR